MVGPGSPLFLYFLCLESIVGKLGMKLEIENFVLLCMNIGIGVGLGSS